MLCTQFYCNTPTHQESVWIHISVVGRSHFVITPSQSKSICPPLLSRHNNQALQEHKMKCLHLCLHFFPGCQLCMYVVFLNMSSRILNKSDACIFFETLFVCMDFFPPWPTKSLIIKP